MRQAIIWTNADSIHWRIYAALGRDDLRRRSKKTSKLRVTGLCAGYLPGTGELSAQMDSNVENNSISWRHRGCLLGYLHHGNTRRHSPVMYGVYQTGVSSVQERHLINKIWASPVYIALYNLVINTYISLLGDSRPTRGLGLTCVGIVLEFFDHEHYIDQQWVVDDWWSHIYVNILSYKHRNSHYKDKTDSRPSHL